MFIPLWDMTYMQLSSQHHRKQNIHALTVLTINVNPIPFILGERHVVLRINSEFRPLQDYAMISPAHNNTLFINCSHFLVTTFNITFFTPAYFLKKTTLFTAWLYCYLSLLLELNSDQH